MKRTAVAVTLVAAGALLAAGGFHLGRAGAADPAAPAPAAAADGRRVLYWHDPMVPGARFDKPGKSPFMDMQLVPVYADGDAGAAGGVTIGPAVQQNLGLRTARVERVDTAPSFGGVGTVQFDERLGFAVQTRVAGYVERLAVRAPLERVRKGQALATVFAPEWLGALNELVALQRAGAPAELIAAARDRTRAMSIPADLVRRAEAGAAPDARFVLTAPAGGVVAELNVREGAAVSPGTTLFRIAGMEQVWAVAEFPESQAAQWPRGQPVTATLQADPSRSFDGRLGDWLPAPDAPAGTLRARFEVDNHDGRLVPGMLLRLRAAGPTRQRLVVPAEAVIRTGQRVVVIVRLDNGGFDRREVTLGTDLGEQIEVLRGLAEGEQVVASGQFLVDSEARLRTVTDRLAPPAAASPASASATPDTAPPGVHAAEGRVESVQADAITIAHGPVATLAWPAMTMGFARPDPAAFTEVRPGDRVRFVFREGGPTGYELVSVERLKAHP